MNKLESYFIYLTIYDININFNNEFEPQEVKENSNVDIFNNFI